MNARKVLALVVVALAATALLLSGCQSSTQRSGKSAGFSNASQTVDPSPLVEAWASSPHSVPVVFAAEEAPCAGCHDGGAFAQGVSDPKAISRPTPFGPYPVATDCRACHTGRGKDIQRSGETTIPSSTSPVKGGAGALCMTCHNQFGKADIESTELAYPHYNPAADVLMGTGGMRLPDFQIQSTTRHHEVVDTCVGCHMTSDRAKSHNFEPNTSQCKKCHNNFESTATVQAAADYDGDGTKSAFAKEIDGLLSKLRAAVNKKAGSTSFVQFRGATVFKSGDTSMSPSAVPKAAYLGAYNYMLVQQDQSGGFHNPWFSVTLLQESYRAVTGSALSGAAKPKGKIMSSSAVTGVVSGTATSSGAATGGAGGSTGATGTGK